MKAVKVRFIWRDPAAPRSYHAGVSLHGHTMHSKECLAFLPRYLRQVPGVSGIVRRYERPSRGVRPPVDFSRAYWTPPLTAAAALRVEREQIAGLGLRPVVSLTDHDDIEAGVSLQLTSDRAETPVSVEWTVPYDGSILHFGIHNLPPSGERAWMAAMEEYASAPREARLPELLESLSRIPGTLIVLNHPFWREEGVGEAEHRRARDRFLRECLAWVHAFELNATRRWKENAATADLARAFGRPLVSGGDRHACEPSGCINLTNAGSFSEFASEIREGAGTILFMPQYREPMALRLVEAVWDTLRLYPEYPARERWTDRIFYRGDDGITSPLSAIWRETPRAIGAAAGIVQFLAAAGLRQAIRLLLAERGEALP